jgi:DNA-binding response OmpR family regulator
MYPDGKHILVIDSDMAHRRLSERLLVDERFAVTAVAEGFSAIRAASATRFALVVAAVDLPGTLDGMTAMRMLRTRQPWLRALYTGPTARRPPLLDRNRDDFIAFPFRRRELLGCVFELLQRESLVHRDRGLTIG